MRFAEQALKEHEIDILNGPYQGTHQLTNLEGKKNYHDSPSSLGQTDPIHMIDNNNNNN